MLCVIVEYLYVFVAMKNFYAPKCAPIISSSGIIKKVSKATFSIRLSQFLVLLATRLEGQIQGVGLIPRRS
jgi:hypothetical protein